MLKLRDLLDAPVILEIVDGRMFITVAPQPVVIDVPEINFGNILKVLKTPKIGENINDTGCRYEDMVNPDGSPRILTYSQLCGMDPKVRQIYIPDFDDKLLAVDFQKRPDEIAWTQYKTE